MRPWNLEEIRVIATDGLGNRSYDGTVEIHYSSQRDIPEDCLFL
ncbi:MAG: hypothetical protein AAF514_22445 [Verrucomicrobiota bacterium]